jgi:hypothetical protein
MTSYMYIEKEYESTADISNLICDLCIASYHTMAALNRDVLFRTAEVPGTWRASSSIIFSTTCIVSMLQCTKSHATVKELCLSTNVIF